MPKCTDTTAQRSELLPRIRAFVRRADGKRLYFFSSYFAIGRDTIMAPMPVSEVTRTRPAKVTTTDDDGTPVEVFAVDPLTWPQQLHLFRQLNFLRWSLDRRLRAVGSRKIPAVMIEEFETAKDVRRLLIASNTRIVKAMIRGVNSPDRATTISDAMIALCRAVDGFNPWRGLRFSTYASVAIKQTCWRGAMQQKSKHTETLEYDPLDIRTEEQPDPDEETGRRDKDIRAAVDQLPARQRDIVIRRFGLDGERQTLVTVGLALGVTKERVRQIELQAKAKLKLMLSQWE